jgi:uncharacterized membrane protein
MNDIKLEAFKQNWEQVRHVENVRLTFTNFYFLVGAAMIAFISSIGEKVNLVSMWYVFFIPIGMSLLGLTISIRTKVTAEYHSSNLRKLAKRQHISEKHLNLYGCLSPLEAKWYQFWVIRISFIWLYSIGFLASLMSLFWVRIDALITKIPWIMMIITIILAIIVLIFLFKKSLFNKVNKWQTFSWVFIPLLVTGFTALFYYLLSSLSIDINVNQSSGDIVWDIAQYSLWVGIAGIGITVIMFIAILVFHRFRVKTK